MSKLYRGLKINFMAVAIMFENWVVASPQNENRVEPPSPGYTNAEFEQNQTLCCIL